MEGRAVVKSAMCHSAGRVDLAKGSDPWNRIYKRVPVVICAKLQHVLFARLFSEAENYTNLAVLVFTFCTAKVHQEEHVVTLHNPCSCFLFYFGTY